MRTWVLLALLPAAAAAAPGGELARSKHNLSASGPGQVKATGETRSCAFCHVAHSGKPGGDNRPDSQVPHQTFRTGRAGALRGGNMVGGSSRMCLSCHDGTVAVGQMVKGRQAAMRGTEAGGRLRVGKANLGLDLSGSHPVSFRPDTLQKTRPPSPGDAVKLDRNGQVQCISCHDPHVEDRDHQAGKFLVKGNRGSAICLSCHPMASWLANPSAHQSSFAQATPPGTPAPASGYRTVADQACGSCHAMHGAGGDHLVKGARGDGEDRVCLSCHDGRVARLDVASEAAKPFGHAAPLAGPSGHDADEGPRNPVSTLPENRPSQGRHATCVDCHDPHAAVSRRAQAPRAGGALAGVWGIDRNGLRVDQVAYEYEVCFKCHADSANQPQARGGLLGGSSVRRAIVDVNLRRVFDPSSPSSHPVEGPRPRPMAGLLRPYTSGSVIYCSDCHSSDSRSAGRSPRGPHGSVYPHILERNYSTGDRTPESTEAYALCYKCHDRDTLYAVQAGARSDFVQKAAPPARPADVSLHARHVQGQATPCSACHNAHGVSALAGNAVNNARLVDFDVSIVQPNSRGLRQYLSRGMASGSCNLTCHGTEHVDKGY